MPVSTSVHVGHCLEIIMRLNPRSVLDVGCGFGLWGFLSRMYLDVFLGRVQREEWQVRIDGLELFEPYIQDHQRWLYSSIRIADIREAADGLAEYELIIAGDVIEHLEKEQGEEVLEALYEKASKGLLVNIPIGKGWDHPEMYGNPGERHRSEWVVEDFMPYPNVHQQFELPNGLYGVFYCPKDCGTAQRVVGLMSAFVWHDSMGNAVKAEGLARKAVALDRDQAAPLLREVVKTEGLDSRMRARAAALLEELGA